MPAGNLKEAVLLLLSFFHVTSGTLKAVNLNASVYTDIHKERETL